MKLLLVYQLGYDADSDQEYLVDHGLFLVSERDADNRNLEDYIVGLADRYWGRDWVGLAYQPWHSNDLDVERKHIFREATR
jgi:hypothetical protein